MCPAQTLLRLAVGIAIGLAAPICEAQATRSHGAHVHGMARLDLAWEGAQVQIRLETPLANLVGFEHRPETAE